MVMTDPLADMFTKIRNANRAKHESVDMPHSAIKESIARILKDKGFIKSFRVVEGEPQNMLRVFLSYDEDSKPIIMQVERISRPGLRQYVKSDAIPKILGGMGVCILSTPKGVMTGEEAREKNVGGELICKIW